MATAWQMDGMLSPWSVEVGESRAPVPQKSRRLQRPCFIPLSRKPVSTAAEQPQLSYGAREQSMADGSAFLI